MLDFCKNNEQKGAGNRFTSLQDATTTVTIAPQDHYGTSKDELENTRQIKE